MAGEPRATGRQSWTAWAFAVILIVAALLQTWLAIRPGLWVDEVFSLAVATGHSLEHPAAAARPALGDFIDHPSPVAPATLAAYAAHDRPPASLRRVVRAAFLSDTSPPLYYVLLSGWTRLAGTSDAALRLFSTLCALVCLPLLWLTGRRIADRTTALIACVLFACAPPALYFATEGRMYALTWVFALGLAWLALRVAPNATPLNATAPNATARGGAGWPLLLAWAVVGAAGLLTHYFFAFVWLAVAAWLWLHRGGVQRARLVAASGLTALLVLPWYARVPESLGLWRVTAGWLNGDLTVKQMALGPLRLITYMVFWSPAYRNKGELLAAVLLVVLVAAMLRRDPRRWVTGKTQLLWLWVLAAAVGPLVFDLLLGTTSSQIGRYGLAGVPAALLLVAVGTSALPRAARAAFVALLVVAWWPGLREVFAEPARPSHPYPQVAARLDAWHRAAPSASSDLVLVHSIPSGSIAVARYLRSGPPIASWTVRAGWRRTRADLDALLAGRCRVALVKTHDFLEDPWPAEGWLRERATLDAREQWGGTAILYFALRGRSPGGEPAPGCAGDQSP